MIDFYIKQLSVTGFNVRPMTLQFQRGANIIYGTSDSGKSYVVECLDFMFGAKTMRLKSSSGYNAVSLTIQTSQGEIYLERRFDVKKESVTMHYQHFIRCVLCKTVLNFPRLCSKMGVV